VVCSDPKADPSQEWQIERQQVGIWLIGRCVGRFVKRLMGSEFEARPNPFNVKLG
jgi:hypothetical protein